MTTATTFELAASPGEGSPGDAISVPLRESSPVAAFPFPKELAP